MRTRATSARRTLGRGLLTSLALCAAPFALADDEREDEPEPPRPATVWEYLRGKYDADEDGVITRAEYTRDDLHWSRLDTDEDGQLTEEEIAARRPFGRRRNGEPREWERERPDPPAVGDAAPDFHLELLPPPKDELLHVLDEEEDEEKERAKLRLSSFRGERPVALVFGSYT